MADSYPEDFASEAEEGTEEEAAEDIAEEEEENNDVGPKANEPEQLPVKLHGYWEKCKIRDVHVLALEKEGTVASKAESQWQTHYRALVPAPNKTKILMLKSHIEQGFSRLPSYFFSNLLQFYGLELHHISPNSLVSIAGYTTLCEGNLGILPRVDLFQLFFCVRPNFEDDGFPHTCGTICSVPQSSKEYPFITPLDSARGWR
jgi:hypothetical protein